jgi:hypothetical protein
MIYGIIMLPSILIPPMYATCPTCLILCDQKYLLNSTNYKDPPNTIFSSFLLLSFRTNISRNILSLN